MDLGQINADLRQAMIFEHGEYFGVPAIDAVLRDDDGSLVLLVTEAGTDHAYEPRLEAVEFAKAEAARLLDGLEFSLDERVQPKVIGDSIAGGPA